MDLGAINDNLRLARELAGGRTVLAAVKADAYGHGLVEVARSIQETGSADWLGVALVAEARQLRDAGITLPILKFSPAFPEELDAAVAADLVLTVADAASITDAAGAAERAGRRVRVHLKVDTGMRRIGAEPRDAVALARRVAEDSWLELDGVYTHLPISDVEEGRDFTVAQLRRFEGIVAEVRDAVGDVPHVHAENSGALLTGSLGATTMVRPGIMVYGQYPDSETPHTQPLAPPLEWVSRVSFVKRVAAGETVGYGRSWTAPRDTWVATVAVGYGDGYSRLLSNRGRMLVGGRSCPIAGRVCMDQTMLDLGPEEPDVSVGDEAVLVGRRRDEEITVAELADLMGTITYEVTCLITARVPRVYMGIR